MTVQERATQDRAGTAGNTILDDAALAVVSPIVIPALLLGLRPLAKTVLKGSLFLTDKLKQLATATSAEWGSMVAEARAEARMVAAPEGVATAAEPLRREDVGPQAGTVSPVNMAIDPAVEPLQQHEASPPPGSASAAEAWTARRTDQEQQVDGADLHRVTGMRGAWVGLLRTAGVTMMHELAQCNPEELHTELMRVNDKDHVVDQVPSQEQVREWIEQARQSRTNH